MGPAQSTTPKDVLRGISPWSTTILVKNSVATPVLIFLAYHAKNPSPSEAACYEVPADTSTSISAGYLREPKATLFIRTGQDEAKLLRVSHGCRIFISTLPTGLKVESPDREVEISDYALPHTVPGRDTFPMVIRGLSFNGGRLLGRLKAPPDFFHPKCQTRSESSEMQTVQKAAPVLDARTETSEGETADVTA